MRYNPTSKKLSFLQLLSNDSIVCNHCSNKEWQPISKIEIPIIQRDYAQGREGKKELRKNFLNSLLEAVNGNPLELDFVYGSLIDNVLQPLDGQQRLTTLFLLHWFVAVKENKLDDELKKLLTKFTYETRASSREFCHDLVNNGIDFNKLLETDFYDKENNKPKNNELSKSIINSSWFFLSWKRDPTIKSMLTMLDSIQQTFKDKTEVWDKLNNISFHYIELQNFGLSDDLYIKMNARGKALTPFENFKARFVKHVKENCWESEKVGLNETFAHKIDTVWTDLFWKFKEKIERVTDDGHTFTEYKIDSRITNFIAAIAINSYAQESEIQSNIDDEGKTRKITVLFNNPNEISPNDFPSQKSFDYLVNCLDKYNEYNLTELKADVNLWKYCGETLFKDIAVNDRTEWQNRVVFFAQTAYLLNAEFEHQSFNDWMRVIRNIVENSTIDSASTFMAAINLIQELTNGCSNIYDYISTNEVTARHARTQIKEEIEKAKIIVAQPQTKQVIHNTEDTSFCKGRIDFALYCADYDIDSPTVFDSVKLESIRKVFEEHLSGQDISNDFRRALFTIQDNDFYDYWTTSKLYVVDSPKRCLIENINELKRNFAHDKKNKWRDYLKELLIALTTQSIDSIVNNYQLSPQFNLLPNWKQRLIKEKDLLNFSEKHYLAIAQDDSCCWLIPQVKVANDNEGRKRLKHIK